MNRTAAFIIGLLTGAAGGSVATYYIFKSKFEEDKDVEMQEMEEYYEQRLKKRLEKIVHSKPVSEKLPEAENGPKSERDDEKVANNKGVKKYHHDNGLESAYGSARIFGEDAKPKKRKESKLINEISEQEFLNNENGYTKQTVDVFMSNDDDTPEIFGIWAYETDNEEPVDKRFGKSTSELLGGRSYEELCTYCGDDGIGQLYLKNDEIMTDFEFVLHKEVTEES